MKTTLCLIFSVFLLLSLTQAQTCTPVSGLVAKFWNRTNSFTGTPAAVFSGDPNVYWRNATYSAQPVPGYNPLAFSLQYDGWIRFPTPGTYLLSVSSDDLTRVWVNNLVTPVINGYVPPNKTPSGTYVATTVNETVPIRIQYYQADGFAYFYILWTAPGGGSPVQIPIEFFSGEFCIPGPKVNPFVVQLGELNDCRPVNISLDQVPAGTRTYTVNVPSDSGFRVTPCQVTFTNANWNIVQQFWVCHSGISSSTIAAFTGNFTLVDSTGAQNVSIRVEKQGFMMDRAIAGGFRNVQVVANGGNVLNTVGLGDYTFLRSADGDLVIQYNQFYCRGIATPTPRICGFDAAIRYCGAYFRVGINANVPTIVGNDNGVGTEVRFADVSGTGVADGDEWHIKLPDGVLFVATLRFAPNNLSSRYYDFSVFIPPHYRGSYYGIGAGRLRNGAASLDTAALEASWLETTEDIIVNPLATVAPLPGSSIPRCGTFCWNGVYKQFNNEIPVVVPPV